MEVIRKKMNGLKEKLAEAEQAAEAAEAELEETNEKSRQVII